MSKLFFVLILLSPLCSFAGNGDGGAGIIQPIAFSPDLILPMTHAKFVTNENEKILFLVKDGQDKPVAIEADEQSIQKDAPEVIDALEESFSSDDQWVEI